MSMPSQLLSFVGLPLTMLATGLLASDVDSAAKLTFASGPNAGTYTLQSDMPCSIGPLVSGDPVGFKARLVSEDLKMSRLSNKPKDLGLIYIRIPNIGSRQHLGELSIDVVFGEPQSRKTPGTAYNVDTVPDGATPGVKDLDEITKRAGMPRKRDRQGRSNVSRARCDRDPGILG